MTSEILVYVERDAAAWHDASREAIVEARTLASKAGATLAALVLAGDDSAWRADLDSLGVDKVYAVVDARLGGYDLDAHAAVLAAVLRAQPPLAFLAAATPRGGELCATVAARLSTPLAPDCVRVEVAPDGSLVALRPVYGGKVYAQVSYAAGHPPMATLRPVGGVPARIKTRPSPTVVDLVLPVDWGVPRCETIGYLRADPATVDLAEAEVIVAGGRGAGSAEGFALLQRLATALGAALGGTRVAVDEGWLPYARQIGQTGKVVAPRLYVACGISGAIHHTAGIKDSKLIVAINSDRHAPIFKIADVAVVGDLHAVVPALTTAVLQAKSARPAGGPAAAVLDALDDARRMGGTPG